MSDFPHSLDRFEIVRILGRGGMGTVYLARDQRLGRQVALKVLNGEELASEEARVRFMREARTAAAIRHQNIATIHEIGETSDGQPFIVMEYCEGETLSQHLKRRNLDIVELLSIARQIAAGVAAAHENGVIHRDLKSANIIIEPSGTAKILDFGLAKLLGIAGAAEKPSMSEGQFFGTLHFLAPEQARGLPADARTDLFSLGVVLYQAGSGHLPFSADSPLMVLEKIRASEPDPFVPLDPGFPPQLAKIINKLLQKKPAERYQSARDLLLDLNAIELPAVRSTTQRTRPMLGPTQQRPRALRFAVAAVGLLFVAAVIFLVRRSSTNAEPPALPVAADSPIRSMAVLPLANLASNARDDFLSVGLADALVTRLQTIPSLQVRPTSAVLEFRDKKFDAKTAREKLGVDGILEGHFLAAGDLVRVNLQLTDSRTGYNVWADTIDGKRDNLLKLIDDVSSRTVNGLNQKLGVKPTTRPYSEARSSRPDAYEQYLRARAMTGSFVASDYDAQLASLRRAIEMDPNFAAAYADLAIAMSLGIARNMLGPDSLEKAEWNARQAVRLDPNLPQAHLALGRVFVRDPDRYRESVREILAALRLNPTDTHALNSVATYFVSSGDMQKAQCIGDRIVRIDPASNEVKMSGYWYVNAVDPEGALNNSKYALNAKDTEIAGHDIRANAYVLQGNLVEAEREARIVTQMAPQQYLGKSLKALIAAGRGNREATETAIRDFERDALRNHWAAIRVAYAYGKLGDRDKAIEWVERAAQLGHHSWYAMVRHPWLQSLQADPAFQAVLTKMKEDLDDVRDDVIGVYQLICG